MLRRYKNLIENMPLYEQACNVKRTLWQQYQNQDRQLLWVLNYFSNHDGKFVVISRGDLFKSGRNIRTRKDFKRFIYATFILGFPNTRRGQISKIIRNIEAIVDLLKSMPTKSDEWKSFVEKTDRIDGLGVATMTKLLYFMRGYMDGRQMLILDSKVINVFAHNLFPDFDHLGITTNNALTRYPDYLKVMNTVAQKLKVDPDKLELFLFTFGSSIKVTDG